MRFRLLARTVSAVILLAFASSLAYGTVEFAATSSNGAETSTPALLTVNVAPTPTSAPVTVDYDVTGGTASGGGVDYTLASGTLNFAIGVGSQDISVTIVDDALDEADETVIVTLSNPTGDTLGTNTAHTYTINDDDPTPTVEFDLTSSNASEATTPADLAVSLSAASGQTITVDYDVTGGTATGSGTDYTLASGTLTFLPSETTHNVSAAIVDDALDEVDETIIVTLDADGGVRPHQLECFGGDNPRRPCSESGGRIGPDRDRGLRRHRWHGDGRRRGLHPGFRGPDLPAGRDDPQRLCGDSGRSA